MNRSARGVLIALGALGALGPLGAACSSSSSTPAAVADTGGAIPAVDAAADAAPSEVEGCAGTKLLASPTDASLRGPWAVGAKRVRIGALLTEIWYPALAASSAGKSKLVYDVRDDLPSEQAAKISDADNPPQPCNDCFRDLPIDGAHGPYPLVVFVHGTAGFKTQNLDAAIHWASRGFVVMAANHPGLSIGSFVGATDGAAPPQADLRGDVEAEIGAMKAAAGDLAPFAGKVDLERIAVVGHSAGGGGAVQSGAVAGVKVVVALSAGAASTSPSVASTLFVTGRADAVVDYDAVQKGYDASREVKRIVGLNGCGHTGVTSLCGIQNARGENIVTVAKNTGVLTGQLAALSGFLFDCDANTTKQADALPVVAYATSAALEETLHCRADAKATLDAIQGRFPAVGSYAHAP